MFTNLIYKALDNALDYGITEFDFWNMTLAEINRAVESKKRVHQMESQERAIFDYKLADLIGRSIARIHSSSSHMPPIHEAYPSIFVAEEVEDKIQEKKDEMSVLRFRQFAQSYNKKFKEDSKE